MSPSADRVQCPFCLGHPRLKNDGTMYSHNRGRPGMLKRCPGSGLTKEQAKHNRKLADEGAAVPSPGDESPPSLYDGIPF